MDLIKIGKFIAERRKIKNITQEKLAEKLMITDRAVSKWERGLSLPDADKMLDLCNILDINVNELLNGEMINKKEFEKKTDDLLIEMAKKEERNNKKLMTSMWVLLIMATLFYFLVIGISAYAFGEGTTFGIIMVIATIMFLLAGFYALKLEVDAGYYECRCCHHKFIPTYKEVLFSMHMSTTRYLKCPKCHKRSWSKKVMTKD